MTVLTLNQQFCSGCGASAAVGGSNRIGTRILREGFGNEQTVLVSVLEDPKVSRALDLGSFSVEFDHRSGFSRDPDV